MAERIGILSGDLWALRGDISTLTGAEVVRAPATIARLDAVLGWAGPAGALARRFAALRGVPFRAVGRGPLRSVRPGRAALPTSLTLAGRAP
ncbi:MAG: hypothetical protein JWQ36_3285, partial [Enterovirga sp.]|nr:hypothetical protein [Enterovirga sp.]